MSLHALDQSFPNSAEWWGNPPFREFPPVEGNGKLLLKEFNLCGGVNLRRSGFDRFNLFIAKTNILSILNID